MILKNIQKFNCSSNNNTFLYIIKPFMFYAPQLTKVRDTTDVSDS